MGWIDEIGSISARRLPATIRALRFIIGKLARFMALEVKASRRSGSVQPRTSSRSKESRCGAYAGFTAPTSLPGSRGELCGQTSWQISQPYSQSPIAPWNSGLIVVRCSMVR
jgi:hypothetical protein